MPKHRVLIVEDEQDIAGLIKHTLERSGDAEADIVSSGDVALKTVTARPPDLIILDLNLPVVGGVEVCRIERVWGYERLVETRSVDVHVGRLRGKLGEAGRQIETVVGLGYRFID